MSAQKFTPGPWAQYAFNPLVIIDSIGASLGEITSGSPQVSREEQVANARLVAQAPDLFAFAQSFLANIDEWDGEPSPGQRWHREYIAAKALIAKVQGGSPT